MDKFINKVIMGDCLIKLKELEDNSIDSIVTDPPAGISFMGKSWDTDKGGRDNWIKWMQEVATECKRVLKPGGHAFVWAIPRTSHWTATAWENAGFEIRDVVAHIFGSGFPKSLNIAKMIDKRGGKSVSWFGKWLREWRKKENIPQKEVSKLFPSKTGGLTGCVANWELGLNMPTNEQFNLICKTFNLPFESLEEAEREIIGTTITNKTVYQNIGGTNISGEINITKGTSEWEGWGTALKPAREDWILMRKPLDKGLTIAENCLKWGTGGINIDESRVGNEERFNSFAGNKDTGFTADDQRTDAGKGLYAGNKEGGTIVNGRFPANLIHDNSEEVRECFPDSKAGKNKQEKGTGGIWSESSGLPCGPEYGDSGNASRFFKSIIYTAKASKSERNRGCEGLEEKQYSHDGRDKEIENPYQRNKSVATNNHPTVKPIALMEYLIKMVTPKGGIVLDPFAGSGSTLVAAKQNGYQYMGIEMTEEYIPIIEARLLGVENDLFKDAL